MLTSMVEISSYDNNSGMSNVEKVIFHLIIIPHYLLPIVVMVLITLVLLVDMFPDEKGRNVNV